MFGFKGSKVAASDYYDDAVKGKSVTHHKSTGDDSPDDGTSKITSFARVSPIGFSGSAIRTSSDIGEVQLALPKINEGKIEFKTWNPTTVLDSLWFNPSKAKKKDQAQPQVEKDVKRQFSSQDDVWTAFIAQFESFLNSNQPKLSVVAVGAAGSGKSHTLFGNTKEQHSFGILPRFIENVFSRTSK